MFDALQVEICTIYNCQRSRHLGIDVNIEDDQDNTLLPVAHAPIVATVYLLNIELDDLALKPEPVSRWILKQPCLNSMRFTAAEGGQVYNGCERASEQAKRVQFPLNKISEPAWIGK